MTTSRVLHKRQAQVNTSKPVRGDAVTIAKKLAYVPEPNPCAPACGLSIPGHRDVSTATSSPTALAMYLANTDHTGLTQRTRETPPSGYSSTNCCGGVASTSCSSDAANITPAGTPVGCCTYRGTGVRPNKSWTPAQLAPWRMGPAPNAYRRIGNVQPRSLDTTARSLRGGRPVATNNLSVSVSASGAVTVTPTLDTASAYTEYLKTSSETLCTTDDGVCRDVPWEEWKLDGAMGDAEIVVQARSITKTRVTLPPALPPPLTCSPYVAAVRSAPNHTCNRC
jgi:hypothetical protein